MRNKNNMAVVQITQYNFQFFFKKPKHKIKARFLNFSPNRTKLLNDYESF